MHKSKKTNKLFALLICFCIFFTMGTTVFANSDIGNSIVEGIVNPVFEKIASWIATAMVSLGDGILHLMTSVVGEPLTIDKLVFNDVDKVDVNYYDQASAGETSIRSIVGVAIEKWYPVFFKTAIMVYMVVLVYVGIAIIISSTADKKAGYKELLSDWVIGVAILILFPYVLKYVVKITDAGVKALSSATVVGGVFRETPSENATLQNMTFFDRSKLLWQKRICRSNGLYNK